MTRSRRGLALIVALLGVAAFASVAEAKKRHRAGPRDEPRAVASRNYPIYESRGVDRNPGGDNLYFQDTKRPDYILGPGFMGWNNHF
jgi:hypothetical protein